MNSDALSCRSVLILLAVCNEGVQVQKKEVWYLHTNQNKSSPIVAINTRDVPLWAYKVGLENVLPERAKRVKRQPENSGCSLNLKVGGGGGGGGKQKLH